MYACMGDYSDKTLQNRIQVCLFFLFFFIFSNGGYLVCNLMPHSNCTFFFLLALGNFSA